MPHLKNSLQINIQARASLLGPNGVFDKVGIIIFDYNLNVCELCYWFCMMAVKHNYSDTANSDVIL